MMNRSILFYKDGAEKLNSLVQKKIAAHLFLLCNYEPENFKVFNDDAKFLTGIVNLYKFMVDASLIHRFKRLNVKLGGSLIRDCRNDFKKLTDYQRLIQSLRTTFVHNITEESGTEDVRQCSMAWLRAVIKKEDFTGTSDYKLALDALDQIAEKVYFIVKKLIIKMVQRYDRTELIIQWEKLIIEFYASSTSRNIVEAQLRMAYLARYPGITDNIDQKVAIWCRDFYLADKENQLKQSRVEYAEFKNVASLEAKIVMEHFMKKLEDEIEGIKKKVAAKCCGDVIENLKSYHYKDYYVIIMNKRYAGVIPMLKADGYTMLPQDIMQYIIERDFED